MSDCFLCVAGLYYLLPERCINRNNRKEYNLRVCIYRLVRDWQMRIIANNGLTKRIADRRNIKMKYMTFKQVLLVEPITSEA